MSILFQKILRDIEQGKLSFLRTKFLLFALAMPLRNNEDAKSILNQLSDCLEKELYRTLIEWENIHEKLKELYKLTKGEYFVSGTIKFTDNLVKYKNFILSPIYN